MRTSGALRYDHDVLHGKLALAEAWTEELPHGRFTLRSILEAIAARMEEHAAREQRLIDALPLSQAQRWQQAHARALAQLAALMTLLDAPTCDPGVRVHACDVLHGIRQLLWEEEIELLPASATEEAVPEVWGG